MEIGDWSACPDLVDVYRNLVDLGLQANLAELEAFGFTVVEGALEPDQTRVMRDRIVELSEERLGRPLDLEKETEHNETKYAQYLLFEDPMFKAAVVNPRPLALIEYLLGKSCILSSLGSHIKGPGGPGLLLHADTSNGAPDPFPPYAQVANVNYAMTDYTEERGAFAVIPGSHRHGRQVTHWERSLDGAKRNPHAIPVEVTAGSAIVFHGARSRACGSTSPPSSAANTSSRRRTATSCRRATWTRTTTAWRGCSAATWPTAGAKRARSDSTTAARRTPTRSRPGRPDRR